MLRSTPLNSRSRNGTSYSLMTLAVKDWKTTSSLFSIGLVSVLCQRLKRSHSRHFLCITAQTNTIYLSGPQLPQEHSCQQLDQSLLVIQHAILLFFGNCIIPTRQQSFHMEGALQRRLKASIMGLTLISCEY